MKDATTNTSAPPERARLDPESEYDLADTSRFLTEVYGVKTFLDESYLNWEYLDNPEGRGVECTRSESGRIIAHMAVIPQRYHRHRGADAEVIRAAVLLNVAIATRARGRGLMTEMGHDLFERTRARIGDSALLAVANASSTPGLTGRLGFRSVCQLPVILLPPLWLKSPRVQSRPVDHAYLESTEFSALLRSVDLRPGSGWSQRWSPESFAWRLKKPGMRYAVHASEDLVLVTTVQRQAGIPICVIVKTFNRANGAVVRGNAVAAAACRFHAAPVALYGGFSNRVRFSGVPLPNRLRPAPLNLIQKPSRPGFFSENAFEIEHFEFFDFDVF